MITDVPHQSLDARNDTKNDGRREWNRPASAAHVPRAIAYIADNDDHISHPDAQYSIDHAG
jgi:hypothetical protein